MPELKTRMGWVTCPKNNLLYSIGLHCCLTREIKTCTHYSRQDKDILYCTYGKEAKEEDESENTSSDIRTM